MLFFSFLFYFSYLFIYYFFVIVLIGQELEERQHERGQGLAK